MKTYKLFFFGIICLLLANCTAQQKSLDIKNFSIKYAWLHTKDADSSHIYCLLGEGVAKTPYSSRTDSIINNWIAKHQNAIVVANTTTTNFHKDGNNLIMTFCWVIQQNDTLNNYLVRNGCFPKEEMERNKTWEEIPDIKKREETKTDFPVSEYPLPKIELLVDKKLDENFMLQIASAEKFARNNKLGIWSDKK